MSISCRWWRRYEGCQEWAERSFKVCVCLRERERESQTITPRERDIDRERKRDLDKFYSPQCFLLLLNNFLTSFSYFAFLSLLLFFPHCHSYYNTRTPGLHFPLMAIIDYRGFRLSAQSILPINKTSICYGSADGGLTIHQDIPGTLLYRDRWKDI